MKENQAMNPERRGCSHGEIETDVARVTIRCRKCGAFATLDAAREPAGAGLDAERLGIAMERAWPKDGLRNLPVFPSDSFTDAIAAEYARLSEPKP